MNWKGIVVHLTASRWGDAAAVNGWHIERGFDGIGYHAVVLNGYRTAQLDYEPELDGKIEPGRPMDRQGAHCLAKGMNLVALGVSSVGTPGFVPEGAKRSDLPLRGRVYLTARQEGALVHVLAKWCSVYHLDPLGSFPMGRRTVQVISQHSDHDPHKPLCASLNLAPLRLAVAAELKRRG